MPPTTKTTTSPVDTLTYAPLHRTIVRQTAACVDDEQPDPQMSDEAGDIVPRVIYIWSVPAIGHLNPTLCFANELLTRLDELHVDRLVIYNAKSFRDMITNLPNNKLSKDNPRSRIEFRDYELEKHVGTDDFLKIVMNFDTAPGSLFRPFQVFT